MGVILIWKHHGRIVQTAVCYDVDGLELAHTTGCIHNARVYISKHPTHDTVPHGELMPLDVVKTQIAAQYPNKLFLDEI